MARISRQPTSRSASAPACAPSAERQTDRQRVCVDVPHVAERGGGRGGGVGGGGALHPDFFVGERERGREGGREAAPDACTLSGGEVRE
jgi:hypothetical protein